jgi:hypothetical protein
MGLWNQWKLRRLELSWISFFSLSLPFSFCLASYVTVGTRNKQTLQSLQELRGLKLAQQVSLSHLSLLLSLFPSFFLSPSQLTLVGKGHIMIINYIRYKLKWTAQSCSPSFLCKKRLWKLRGLKLSRTHDPYLLFGSWLAFVGKTCKAYKWPSLHAKILSK